MFQRSQVVTGRLGPRCSWGRTWGSGGPRWGQGESPRCCSRVRLQALEPCWDKVPQGLAPSHFVGSKFYLLPVKRHQEAAALPLLPLPVGSDVTSSFSAGQKPSLYLLLQGLEHRTLPAPPGFSLLEGMGGTITTADGQQEDDIAVQDSEGFDGASLDSLRSLFRSQPCRTPYQTPEAVLGLMDPFQAAASAPSSSGSPSPAGSPGSHEPTMEEHLATMHEKLQHELPNFFLKIPNYGIYSRDVELISEILNLKTRGLVMYQLAMHLYRFVAWNYFAHVRMEVLKVTQHPENWSIQARWRVTGLPFHVLLLRFYKLDKNELYRTYDAHSTFFLDSQGLIHRHRIDKVMPSQPPVN
uniref:Chromosome 6 open reading frame 136 n=1 Tax=Sphenodon punctatus TaxID=8508 RepID=A0A8D0HGZ4_SPHPU